MLDSLLTVSEGLVFVADITEISMIILRLLFGTPVKR